MSDESTPKARRIYSSYTTQLWKVAISLAEFDLERLRLLEAYFIVHLFYLSSGLTEALSGIERQLTFLDPPLRQHLVGTVKEQLRAAAKQMLEQAPAGVYQELLQFELEQRLAALQRQELHPVEIVDAIGAFVTYGFLAAQATVETCLSSSWHEEIRAAALRALVEGWHLPGYQQLLPTFLGDPDIAVRWMAIELLAAEKKGSQDIGILQCLAAIILSEEDDAGVRLQAYEALYVIAGLRQEEQLATRLSQYVETYDDFASAPGVDWKLVRHAVNFSPRFVPGQNDRETTQ